MKKTKSLVAIALVGIMLAGCGVDGGTSSAQNTSSAASQNSSTAAVKTEVDKSIPIRILIPYTPFDVKTDNAVLELEKGTGFTIEFDTLPEKNSMDKLNLIFSSGKVDYDYIRLGSDEVSKSLFITYAKKGLLADLTEDIKNYPNLQEIEQSAYKALTYNDKLYGIPSTGMPYASNTGAIRMDWLEKVGLSVPTNIDELYTVLKAFKEKDPGGLGVNNIPFVANPSVLISSVSQAFGILYEYEVRSDKIEDMRLTPEYKEYLVFMNKLYSEGLLDPDMPVNTGSKMLEKCASGKVGFYCGGTDGARDLLISKHNAGENGTYFQIMPPLKDKSEKQRSTSLEGLFSIGLIPASSTNVNGVLSYMDTYLSPDVFESIIHGVNGVDYKEENGERTPILPAFDKNRGNMYALYPVQNGELYFPLWKLRTKKTPEAGMYFAQVFEETSDYLDVNPLAYSPSFDTVSERVKLVQEYAVQESTKFISGARSLDEFDQYVKEMNDKGTSQIVSEYNTWYAEK